MSPIQCLFAGLIGLLFFCGFGYLREAMYDSIKMGGDTVPLALGRHVIQSGMLFCGALGLHNVFSALDFSILVTWLLWLGCGALAILDTIAILTHPRLKKDAPD